MPIYQWKCVECEAIVEELRKIGEDDPPERCVQCDSEEFKKQLTTANFRIDPAAG